MVAPTNNVRLVTLDPAMERRLRATSTKARDATTERDELIVEAAAAGGSLREIGEATGLHFTTVRKIIQRDT